MFIRKTVLSLGAASGLLLATPALAGSFASGYGTTPQDAMDAALSAAEAAVKSRGEGCISPYKGEIFHGLEKRTISGEDLWYVRAHYSHHAGSCGQYSRDEKYLRETAERILGL